MNNFYIYNEILLAINNTVSTSIRCVTFKMIHSNEQFIPCIVYTIYDPVSYSPYIRNDIFNCIEEVYLMQYLEYKISFIPMNVDYEIYEWESRKQTIHANSGLRYAKYYIHADKFLTNQWEQKL